MYTIRNSAGCTDAETQCTDWLHNNWHCTMFAAYSTIVLSFNQNSKRDFVTWKIDKNNLFRDFRLNTNPNTDF